MLAPTQRRRFSSFLLLPLVIAIVLLVVAKLIALQRADIIAQLADRVAHCDSQDAATAVRQLASMPDVPVSILVCAATAADADVAEEARYSISQFLRHAQRQIESGRRLGAVSRRLADLAASLDDQKDLFAEADYPWVSSTTRKVLRLANRLPARQTPLLAVHCDAVLTRIANHKPTTYTPHSEIVDNEPEVESSLIGEGAMVSNSEQTRQANSRRAAAAPHAVSGPSAQIADRSAGQTNAPSNSRPAAQNARVVAVISKDKVENRRTQSDATAETHAQELNSPWRASWSHPIFRMAPARPILDSTEDAAKKPAAEKQPLPPAPDEPAGDQRQATGAPLADVDSRLLLRRWLEADGSDIFPLEKELTRRGFGRLSERFVQRLFSPKVEDRLAFVDDVLTEPGVDARPWLMLLAEDSDGDVRLMAVTIMATSNDSSLVDKAWQVSIRDHDPRIARLAARLRERRESAQQR